MVLILAGAGGGSASVSETSDRTDRIDNSRTAIQQVKTTATVKNNKAGIAEDADKEACGVQSKKSRRAQIATLGERLAACS